MIEVVAALIVEKGKLLICRRPPHKARGGLWEFAGGKVEAGEDKRTALCRECREELGIEISVGSPFAEVTHAYPDLTLHLTFFWAKIAAGTPCKREHTELRLVSPSDFDGYAFCPADRDILEKLKTDAPFLRKE